MKNYFHDFTFIKIEIRTYNTHNTQVKILIGNSIGKLPMFSRCNLSITQISIGKFIRTYFYDETGHFYDKCKISEPLER